MREYRRKGGSAEWHWNEACKNWPDRNYERRTERPPGGPFCKKCEEADNA